MPSKTVLEIKQAEAEKEESKPKRKARFNGFKAKLNASVENFAASIDIRYAKITSREIDEKLVIIMVDDEGNIVERKRIGEPNRYVFVNERGKEVSKHQIHYLQVLENGELVEVVPFERTRVLDTIKTINMAEVDDFLEESVYELWSDNVEALSKVAVELQKQDKAIVSKISFGGFREYYALIYPIFREGEFVMQMVLTRMKKEFSHWMPVNGQEIKIPRRTVNVLPEI